MMRNWVILSAVVVTVPGTLAGCALRANGPHAAAAWPQAAGPHANWIAPESVAPTTWSVARNENILWRCPLPNSGQGGIAVVGDRIYLTTFPEQAVDAPRQSNRVLCHAIDRATGRIVWSRELSGGRASPQMYAFSDSTSWSPIASHARVWFFNSSGVMACFDRDGGEVWRREFRTQPDAYPFNRQCEPIAVGEFLVTIEPIAKDHARYDAARDDWNYLHAVDRATGKVAWISEDPCTFYCTPVLGPRGILIGRGGPHDVPEKPVGLSMIDPASGKRVWAYEPVDDGAEGNGGWEALYALHSDAQYAYWFRNGRVQSHVVLDASTGVLVREQPLGEYADVLRFDPATLVPTKLVNADLRRLPDPVHPLAAGEELHVHPQWHTNLVAGGYHWFLCTTNNRRNGLAPPGHSGPAYSLGRVHVETGRVEYMELPVGVDPAGEWKYGAPLRTKTVDARGVEIADEDRSRTDGWEIDAFFPTPVVLGKHLYITTMLGTVYVLDTTAEHLDQRALVAVNDLGPLGDCWSMSGPSCAGGILYHRNARELVAIGVAR
jgi:outer membrane protein assembly factor BamB